MSSHSQNVLPKVVLLPHLNKCQSPWKEESQSPPPPSHLYPNHHAPDDFLSFQFLLIKKKTDNAQLCILVKLKQ